MMRKKILLSGFSPGLATVLLLVMLVFFNNLTAQNKNPGKSESKSKIESKSPSKSKSTSKSTSTGKSTSKSKSKKKVPEFTVSFGLATIYDDNILKYSDKYLQRFMNNEDAGRFHIETYDDIILNPSLQLTASYRIFGKQKSEVNASFDPKFYLVNDIKNYSSYSVGFRQYLPKRFNFKLSYSYIPDFYIRHFRDEDLAQVYGYIPETFVPMGFAKDAYGFFLHKTIFKNAGIRFTLNYSKYYYNKHYTEYDSKDLYSAIRFYQPINKKLKFEVGYGFTNSNAKGYDGPGESKEHSDDSNADFDQDEFSFDLIWQIPDFLKRKNSFTAAIDYQKRYFTTTNYVELDPEHAGRVDQVLNLEFSYNISLNKAMQLSAFYKWYDRNSTTSSPINSAYVSAEKDYRQAQLGLEFIYNLKY